MQTIANNVLEINENPFNHAGAVKRITEPFHDEVITSKLRCKRFI
jgi:hypothetical protein